MAPLEKAKDAEADDDKGRRKLDFAPPFGEAEQKAERQQHQEDRQQMPG